MSQQLASAKPHLDRRWMLVRAGAGIAATVLLTALGLRAGGLQAVARFAAGGSPHPPRLSLLAQAPPAIQVHVAAVLLALAGGTVLLSGVKGSRLHRGLGWAWVAAMATAATASLFIHVVSRGGGFSFLHLFAGWTLIALPIGVAAARRHNVRLHGRMMAGLFVGGLLVAGVTAFLPGRLMWQVFFG